MKRMMFAMCLACLSWQAFGATWQCRNDDLEVRCDDAHCSAQTDGFTPVSLSLDTARGTLEVCAYSGCWSGRARMLRDGPQWLASGRSLAWSGAQSDKADMRTDLLFALDGRDRIGVLKGAGFAMPLRCEAGD